MTELTGSEMFTAEGLDPLHDENTDRHSSYTYSVTCTCIIDKVFKSGRLNGNGTPVIFVFLKNSSKPLRVSKYFTPENTRTFGRAIDLPVSSTIETVLRELVGKLAALEVNLLYNPSSRTGVFYLRSASLKPTGHDTLHSSLSCLQSVSSPITYLEERLKTYMIRDDRL